MAVLVFLTIVGEFLILPVWMYDLMAAQTPPQELGLGDLTVLTFGSFLCSLLVVWSVGRPRPGRLRTSVLRAVVLLGLCLAVALWLRDRVGTENWSLGASLECVAAGVTALFFRKALPRWERGRPMPGEVWLAMVPFRERAEEARHYCVVVGRGLTRAHVLQITSQNKDHRDDHVRIPNEGWDFHSGKDLWMEIGLPPRRVPYRKFLKDTRQGPCPRVTWRRIRADRQAYGWTTALDGMRWAAGPIARLRGGHASPKAGRGPSSRIAD